MIFTFFFLLFIQTTFSAIVDCGTAGYKKDSEGSSGDFCLGQFHSTYTHSAAITFCANSHEGGKLVDIKSSEYNDFVKSVINTEISWIGANDIASENTWVWTDGSLLSATYSNWALNEPNNAGGEDCALINWNANGEWNDISCDNSYKTLCEYNETKYDCVFGHDGSDWPDCILCLNSRVGPEGKDGCDSCYLDHFDGSDFPTCNLCSPRYAPSGQCDTCDTSDTNFANNDYPNCTACASGYGPPGACNLCTDDGFLEDDFPGCNACDTNVVSPGVCSECAFSESLGYWQNWPECNECYGEFNISSGCKSCNPFYDPETLCTDYYHYDDYSDCKNQQFVQVEVFNDDFCSLPSFVEYWPSTKCVNLALEEYVSVRYTCNHDGTIQQELFSDFECKKSSKFFGKKYTPTVCSDEISFTTLNYHHPDSIRLECGFAQDEELVEREGVKEFTDQPGVYYFMHDYDNETKNTCDITQQCIQLATVFPIPPNYCAPDFFNLGVNKWDITPIYSGPPPKFYKWQCTSESEMSVNVYDDPGCSVSHLKDIILENDGCSQISYDFLDFVPFYGVGTTSTHRYGTRFNAKWQCEIIP